MAFQSALRLARHPHSRARLLLNLLAVGLTGALCYFALRNVRFDEAWRGLRHGDWW